MKHIKRENLSAFADKEILLEEDDRKHLEECEECRSELDRFKSLKIIVSESKPAFEEWEGDFPYTEGKLHRPSFRMNLSFALLFLISIAAGMLFAGSAKSDNLPASRNEFTEMENRYASSEYVFPFEGK